MVNMYTLCPKSKPHGSSNSRVKFARPQCTVSQHSHWSASLKQVPNMRKARKLPVTRSLSVSSMSDSDKKIRLNCFVFGVKDSEPFDVSISTGVRVTHLVKKIIAQYKIFYGRRAKLPGIALFKIALSEDQLPDLQLPPKTDELRLIREVGYYWSDPSEINKDLIHVLAYSEGG
jgi:hypothetical protein